MSLTFLLLKNDFPFINNILKVNITMLLVANTKQTFPVTEQINFW